MFQLSNKKYSKVSHLKLCTCYNVRDYYERNEQVGMLKFIGRIVKLKQNKVYAKYQKVFSNK